MWSLEMGTPLFLLHFSCLSFSCTSGVVSKFRSVDGVDDDDGDDDART